MSDKQAELLDQLVNDYLPAFLAFALKRTGNYHEAEELAQETLCQCVKAINGASGISNFNAFVWSIAYNTYKRWCAFAGSIRQKSVPIDDNGNYNSLTNVLRDEIPVETELMNSEEYGRIRLELSRLSNLYRQTLVCFYYDELSISETAEKLCLSIEMVKFYLQKGRKKLKEAYVADKKEEKIMSNNNIGDKSFNPSEFSVYKAAIDFSKVNVWEVFKRRLPCQIALVCYDSAKSVSEITLETGVPAVYIEEELDLLINAARGKYRTNLFILKKNAVAQVKEQFDKLYTAYAPIVINAYDKYLSELKNCGIFKQNVPDYRYTWFFMNNVVDFNFNGYWLSNEDYPQILSCGSKGFIFAQEAKNSPWGMGRTPTELDKCVVWPVDIMIFGKYHCQSELRDKRKARALYDVYTGQMNDNDIEIYAQLIEEGYVVKINGTMYCNVAVTTVQSRELFEKINTELNVALEPLCKEIRANIARIVKSTIPEQLKDYAKGYTETWIQFYSGVYFREALYGKGFVALPEQDSKIPVACYIYEK